jgi:hypothetical protein
LAEGKTSLKVKPSFRLTGNVSRLGIGDMNNQIISFNNNTKFEYLREFAPDRLSGGIKEVSRKFENWEAEFRFEIRPKIGVGISITPPFLYRNSKSSLTYIINGSAGTQTDVITYDPKINVAFVRMNFYYTLISWKSINVLLHAGIGNYSGWMRQSIRYEFKPPTGSDFWIFEEWKAQQPFSPGIQGGIGVEIYLSKRVAISIEAQGHYARLSNLKGTDRWTGTGGFEDASKWQPGTLYYFSFWDDDIGARYSYFSIWKKPPDGSISEIEDVRKAILELKGSSIKAGLKINLF